MVMTPAKMGKADYYLNLARAEYYLEKGEAKGYWYGSGAVELGLANEVESHHFLNLARGFSPDKSMKTQNAGKENRVSGWDFCFSVPKSISSLFATCDLESRLIIEACHQEAVKEVLDFIESELVKTRRGKGGSRKESAKLVFGLFQHSTSRNLDPQLHTHAVMLNVALRHDGTFGALEPRQVFHCQKGCGALYRASLFARLHQHLGVRAERVKDHFELLGRNDELCEVWSSRHQEILDRMAEKGHDSYLATRYHAISSRKSKNAEDFSREELFELWQELAEKKYKITKGQGLTFHERGEQQRRSREQLFSDIIGDLTAKNAVFHEYHLINTTAIHAQTEVMRVGEIFELVEELKRRLVIVDEKKRRYTTQEHLGKEYEVASLLVDSQEEGIRHKVKTEVVDSIIEQRASSDKPLSEQHKKALKHITCNQQGSINLIQGLAGVGKTHSVISTATCAYQQMGYRVLGVAPTGKASAELASAGVNETYTIHSLLFREKLAREKGRGFILDDSTVIILDEASMVGTDLARELLKEVKRSGASLQVIGDVNQLSSVEAGGFFHFASGRLGAVSLDEIKRQEKREDRESLKAMASGDVSKLVENADIRYFATPKGACNAMFKLWKEREVDSGADIKDSVMLVERRREAHNLNLKAQEVLLSRGNLGIEHTAEINGYVFYENDRILFRHNSPREGGVGVQNGDIGTIVGVDSTSDVTVELDNGNFLKVDLEDFHQRAIDAGRDTSVELGYASTTDSKQGATLERVYGYSGERAFKEFTFVQASRHRKNLTLFTLKETAYEALNRNSEKRDDEKNHERFSSRIGRSALKKFALYELLQSLQGAEVRETEAVRDEVCKGRADVSFRQTLRSWIEKFSHWTREKLLYRQLVESDRTHEHYRGLGRGGIWN